MIFFLMSLSLCVVIVLTVCHLNTISLVKNNEKLEDFVSHFARKPDICISETRVSDGNVKYVGLPGYTFVNNSSCSRAGGVGIYVFNSICCHELDSFRMHLKGCEDIWIEVILSDKSTLVIGSVYRHPPIITTFAKFSPITFLN